MIAFDEAVAIVAAAARPLGRETVPIGAAGGRVLSSPVRAAVAAPPGDVSAMDGYAVRDADLSGFPARLCVIGESFAGSGFLSPVEPGTCVRIFTGAPVPVGADRVVVQEIVRREGGFAILADPPGPGRHIRARGSDFAAGDLLLGSGRRLGYRELVTAAGGDVGSLEVWRKPRLFLLATGDELAEPGTARLHADAVPESVSFGVSALAAWWGAEMVGQACLRDDLGAMEKHAAQAVAAADLVIVTGGASVGERDFAKTMFAPLGLELLFAKVAIKPGKPVWFGRAGGALVMGLPGNPTSAMVTARLFLAPLLAGLSGLDPGEASRWRPVALAAALPACGDRETFVRASLSGGGATPLGNQDSSSQRSLAAADLLLRRPAGAPPAPAGAFVEALDF